MIEDIRYSRKINWPVFLLFVVLMFLMLFYFDKAIAAEANQPDAVALAEKSIQAIGGKEGFSKLKALRFDFRVERAGAEPRGVKHLWDRANNRDHIEGNRDGKAIVAWVNLTSKTGAAWQEGKKLEGDALKEAMDWAYGRWVNDTYWLVMPFKWLDKGVNLEKAPDRDGYNVLHVSFDQVGLTPGDQYWVFLNPKTQMMEKWEFLLQGDKEKAMFDWKEWGDY